MKQLLRRNGPTVAVVLYPPVLPFLAPALLRPGTRPFSTAQWYSREHDHNLGKKKAELRIAKRLGVKPPGSMVFRNVDSLGTGFPYKEKRVQESGDGGDDEVCRGPIHSKSTPETMPEMGNEENKPLGPKERWEARKGAELAQLSEAEQLAAQEEDSKKTIKANQKSRRQVERIRLSLEKDVASTAACEEQDRRDLRKSELKEGEWVKRVYFSEREMEEANENMKAVMRQQEAEDMALAALTERGRRLPHYLYSVIPDALRSVERQVNALRLEMEMLRYDRQEMRERRRAVRRLLWPGRKLEYIKKAYRVISRSVSTIEHFAQLMVYLIHYRRLFRLSSLILRALGASMSPHPDDIGKAYHMLIAERLQPFVDAPRNKKNVKKMEQVAADCVGLLHAMLDGRADHKWPIVIPQPAVYLLGQMAPIHMLSDLYWKLVTKNSRVREFTGFHLVSRLARPNKETGISYWKEGFEILKHMQFKNGQLGTIPAKHTFYAVLYQAMRDNNPDATEEILQTMLECGLEPGVEVYNMLMARAAEEKDEAKLKKYFDAIAESGHRPSLVTHGIAHAFHKHHSNERQRVAAMEEGLALDQRLNLFFATDILHAAVLHRKPYEEIFRRYRLFFTTRLLERFHIALPGVNTPHMRKRRLEPDHVTLAVMLTAYCNSERNVNKIWDLFKLYTHYLNNRQKANWVTRRLLLASGPYIPHIIMMGLGKRMQGLPYVAAVLEDMLKPDAAIDSDVYSWSIFLHCLTQAGKMEEAETVMKVMRSRGLTPNTVTMTTLLNGYVKQEQLGVAENVLDRIHEAGLSPNVYTWTALLHGYVKEGQDWKAGDVFKRMLDSSVQPDEVTLQAVSGITDRKLFEAGLSGQMVDQSENGAQQAVEQQEQRTGDYQWFRDEEEEWDGGRQYRE
ncbi:hypothetical protein FN846DRAFT_689196 [Sphaerosporella brunnea]|uniref:Pentacotripeptide-repeat region of PRORP domain-containing protein n=1 Tax=Sphaerosporella brunnea TaxID=1250544 RepID=A0A5J5EYZ5_9PEZI|nr:hypothetical protein FN846DRAFT_689196 [Sphaerosporella brunnea]